MFSTRSETPKRWQHIDSCYTQPGSREIGISGHNGLYSDGLKKFGDLGEITR